MCALAKGMCALVKGMVGPLSKMRWGGYRLAKPVGWPTAGVGSTCTCAASVCSCFALWYAGCGESACRCLHTAHPALLMRP